jgi:hypothetical protein
MGVLQKIRGRKPTNGKAVSTDGTNTPQQHADLEKEAGQPLDNRPVRLLTLRVFMMGIIVSIGGLIFGYDTGQISGFLEMPNFLDLFADTTKDGRPAFSNSRSGTIVGLVGYLCARLSCLLYANLHSSLLARFLGLYVLHQLRTNMDVATRLSSGTSSFVLA